MTTAAVVRGGAPAVLRRIGVDPLRQTMMQLGHVLPRRADSIVLLDFLEDDLREGLDALSDIESHFSEVLEALRAEVLCPAELVAAGEDGRVLKRLEVLEDTVVRLRRRLSQAAALMRQRPTT